MTTETAMNSHEQLAWRRLVERGAKEIELGGKPALDLSALADPDVLRDFLEVVGRSGAVRRHVDRRNRPVFVVSDVLPGSR